MKKRLSIILIFLMMVCMLPGCGTEQESVKDSAVSKSEKKAAYKFAVVPQSLNDPYQITWSNAAKAYAESLGHECVVLGADGGSMADVAGQITVIENIISNGSYDGILYASQSSEGAVTGIEKCIDAGLPIVMVDNRPDYDTLESDGYDPLTVPFIGTISRNAASATGKWIKENYPEGVKLAKINGPEGSDNGISRREGLDEGLDGWAALVGEQSTESWAVDEAYTAAQNLITANSDIELIFCACDTIAVGCRSALEEMGKAGQIDIIGFDGTADGLDMLLEGKIVAETCQLSVDMGQGGIDLLLKKMDGENPEQINDSGYLILDTKEKTEEYKELIAQYQ